MWSPCFNCQNRYGQSYTEDCNSKCDYAYQLSRLKAYGGIDKVIECMEGKAVQVALLNKENIDYVYTIVKAAKDQLI